MSECPGNEARPKLCWEYQSGLGMRLGPNCVGVSWELEWAQTVLGCPGNETRPKVLYYPWPKLCWEYQSGLAAKSSPAQCIHIISGP